MVVVGTAWADAPAPKWYDTIGLSGYVQESYTGNLNNPLSKTNKGRQFDVDSNSFMTNAAMLNIIKPVGDSDHYGFVARLMAGRNAHILANSTNGNSDASLFLQEAYMTYALPALTKLQFIAGKFVTSEGVEVVDTINNPNFSEGLLFTYAEPVTHTGLKASYTFNDKVNAMVGVVNGWDLSTDNNSGKTVIWQVAVAPTKKISWSFQGLYGPELADNMSQRLSLDTVLGFNPTDKLSLNAQANWGQQTHDPNTANSTGVIGAGKTHWAGAGLWASYALTSRFTEIGRFEVLSDQNGANRFGVATPSPFLDGTTNQTVKEFTLTHKTQLASNLFTRVEYRHDWSNQAYFERHDGSAVRNQNTLSADVYITF